MRYRSHEPHRNARYISLTVFFAVFVCIFAIRLIHYQLANKDDYAAPVIADGNVRTVTVKAQRGNICDRNGTVIVGNKYTYTVSIEYGALPEKKSDAYAAMLGALDLLELTDTPRASDVFPLSGEYPNYSYTDDSRTDGTLTYKKLKKVIEAIVVSKNGKYQDFDTAYKNMSASDLALFLAKYYEIVSVAEDGKITSDYSDKDIGRLINLRYNMIAGDFPYAPYVIAEGVSEQMVAAVKERHLTGITVTAVATRVSNFLRPDGVRYAASILGTVGIITAETADYYTELGYPLDATVGRSGCELAFEEYLRGVDGELAIVEDDNGYIVETYWVKEPAAGKDVWLTIDINVQISAENSLISEVEKGGSGGAVAATDPNTGEILALASYPDDAANKAISAYAPGSTFKVGMALAALNEDIIEESSLLPLYGSYAGLRCNNHGESSCSGSIGVIGAIGCSCNYFFCHVGDELGIERIREYATLYGFGQPTGLEIGLNASTPESSGRLEDRENMDYMAGIGQLHLATPLQISQYISMIVNGGTRYSAHILKRVKNFATDTAIYEKKAEAVASLSEKNISDSDIYTVCRGMYEVVYGNGASSYVSGAFRSAPYKVGGKTGTAEVSGQSTDNAFFVGYAPFDAPKIVVTAFIEEGRTGGLASGIVRDVMDAYSENVSPLASENNNEAAG